MSLLAALTQSGALRPLDHALAQTLKRLDPAIPEPVLVAAALASLALAHGHSGFDPAAPEHLIGVPVPWPSPQPWCEQLAQSPWVACPESAQPAAPAPLVLEHGLVYLRRYREYERQLAQDLHRIGGASMPTAGADTLTDVFAQLFPPDRADKHQARAATLAQDSPLLLLTGGPGTGKTTTIARLLILRVAQQLALHQPPPRIALAAPTGRAAERMAESLRRAVQSLLQAGIDPALCAALEASSSTVHRLLGAVPDSTRFRHHPDHPLPFDIVVIDEASMLDLALMAKLAAAIATGTQLLLLGDPEQLPSVETGDVLRALVASSETGPSPARRVHLHRSYRQSDALDLAPLAKAVREGDSARTLALLRGGALLGVYFHEDHSDPLALWQAALHRYWQALTTADTPAQALSAINRLRILTAVREGPQGAHSLNARIEHWLTGRTGAGYFHGRLLMVSENSERHQLYNGDTGLCLQDASGAFNVWFAGEDPAHPRAFHPAALPACESAFAMTIHKAQGAEFDEIWLQLPQHPQRVLSRELIYTGLTRARKQVHLAGRCDVIEAALSRHTRRWSGLAQRLR